ncbi:MAG: hypothetical protein RM049_26640 [Nostoc sp. DedQUE04]|uniref:hypothetical protein n=1 Tax=Nostoc sp. DedQUE04 TaxID=3075390 RepID=UPI002AD42E2A|nr:hypothetical protein [Nostoc sp. DedQUE04]MDZ8138838.1 hypothetical protein [Nostoc sp. DedQUE04]
MGNFLFLGRIGSNLRLIVNVGLGTGDALIAEVNLFIGDIQISLGSLNGDRVFFGDRAIARLFNFDITIT